MPRAKFDSNQEHILQMFDVANLKSYSTDLLYDAKIIYKTQLQKYREWFLKDDLKRTEDRIKALESMKIVPINKTRVYIVSCDTFICFAMYNMDECVVDNLCDVFDLVGISLNEAELVKPNFRSTLFVFKGKNLLLSEEISTTQLAKLMAIFYKENLVNYSGARYDYYGKPRRDTNHRK
nr:hypothetical protein [uncultured Caproiciproducens sp.]